jgi:tetratricopeptide (TPR) repeat protein
VVDPAREIAGDLLDVLSSLSEKSLLRTGEGPAGEPRFGMLETIRDYAAEKLADTPAVAALRDRHLAYFVAYAEAHESELTSGHADTAFAEVAADHDNIVAAIEWSVASGSTAGGLRLGGAIWRYWQQRGHLSEGRRLMAGLLAAPASDADPQARARGLTGYGGVLYWQGDHVAARAAYEEALELYRQAGDEARVALGLFDLATTVAIGRDLDTSRRMFDESAATYARLGDEKGRLRVREGLAGLALMDGDLAGARDIGEEVVSEYEGRAMKYQLADTLTLLCAIYLGLGDADNARSRLAHSIDVWNEIGDVSARAGVIQFGAALAVLERRHADAARLVGALAAMRDRGGPFLTPAENLGLPDPEIAARAALPAAEFDAAYAEGRSWPIETALKATAA